MSRKVPSSPRSLATLTTEDSGTASVNIVLPPKDKDLPPLPTVTSYPTSPTTSIYPAASTPKPRPTKKITPTRIATTGIITKPPPTRGAVDTARLDRLRADQHSNRKAIHEQDKRKMSTMVTPQSAPSNTTGFASGQGGIKMSTGNQPHQQQEGFTPRAEFQQKAPRSTPYALLSLHSTSSLRLLHFPPSIYPLILKAIEKEWPGGIESSGLMDGGGMGWGCEMVGEPWKKAGNEELESIRLILALLSTLSSQGWTLLDGIQVGSNKKDTHSFVFRQEGLGDGAGVDGEGDGVGRREFFALSLPLADRISLINPPPTSTPALISSIRLAILNSNTQSSPSTFFPHNTNSNPPLSQSAGYRSGSLSSRDTGDESSPSSPVHAGTSFALTSMSGAASGMAQSTGAGGSGGGFSKLRRGSTAGQVKIKEEGWVTDSVYGFHIGGYKGMLGGLRDVKYDSSHPSLLLALLHNLDSNHFELTTSIPLLPFKKRRDILFFQSIPQRGRESGVSQSRLSASLSAGPMSTPTVFNTVEEEQLDENRMRRERTDHRAALGSIMPPTEATRGRMETVYQDTSEMNSLATSPRLKPMTTPAPRVRRSPDDHTVIIPPLLTLSEELQQETDAARYAREQREARGVKNDDTDLAGALGHPVSATTESTPTGTRGTSMATVVPALLRVDSEVEQPEEAKVGPGHVDLTQAFDGSDEVAMPAPRLPPRPAPLSLPTGIHDGQGLADESPQEPTSTTSRDFPPPILATGNTDSTRPDRSTTLDSSTQDAWVMPEGEIPTSPNGKQVKHQKGDGGENLLKKAMPIFGKERRKRRESEKGEEGISKADIQVIRNKVEQRRGSASGGPPGKEGARVGPEEGDNKPTKEIETAPLPHPRPVTQLNPDNSNASNAGPTPITYIPIAPSASASPTAADHHPDYSKFNENFRDTLEIPRDWVGDPVKGKTLRNSTEAGELFRRMQGGVDESTGDAK